MIKREIVAGNPFQTPLHILTGVKVTKDLQNPLFVAQAVRAFNDAVALQKPEIKPIQTRTASFTAQSQSLPFTVINLDERNAIAKLIQKHSEVRPDFALICEHFLHASL
jgi:hypothetical protein